MHAREALTLLYDHAYLGHPPEVWAWWLDRYAEEAIQRGRLHATPTASPAPTIPPRSPANGTAARKPFRSASAASWAM